MKRRLRCCCRLDGGKGTPIVEVNANCKKHGGMTVEQANAKLVRRRRAAAEAEPAATTPEQAIAGSLRAMADYIEAEAEARGRLIVAMKSLRLDNIKLVGEVRRLRDQDPPAPAGPPRKRCTGCHAEKGIVSQALPDCPVHGAASERES